MGTPKEKTREEIIKYIIETNHQLVMAIFDDKKHMVTSYRTELNRMIDFILEK